MKLLNKKRKFKRQVFSLVSKSKNKNKKKIINPIISEESIEVKGNFIAELFESQVNTPNGKTKDNKKEIIKGKDLIFEKRKSNKIIKRFESNRYYREN